MKVKHEDDVGVIRTWYTNGMIRSVEHLANGETHKEDGHAGLS